MSREAAGLRDMTILKPLWIPLAAALPRKPAGVPNMLGAPRSPASGSPARLGSLG